MIIGIDGNEANVEKRVGIGAYAFELLKQFHARVRMDKEGVQFRIYLKDQPRVDMPEIADWWSYEIVKPQRFWTQFALPLRLFIEKNKPDVFFSPSHYAPRFCTIPTAISVMDLSYIHFPELFAKKDLYQLVHWTKYSVMQAKKIFTISESSKNDIINYYHVPSEKAVVTYLGIKEESKKRKNNMEELQKKYGITKNFILFVGTIQPRKNIGRLIEAFKIIKEGNRGLGDLQLVIVGKKGWLYEPILAKPHELGIEDQVKFLDFVSDEELQILYGQAICFVLPSLYEGFGLPVLEAMKCGCPVVTSNVSSLPEAGGNAALYVNPENVNDIAEKILLLVEDKKLRNNLIEKGYEQIKKFNWEKTAKETLDVLQSLAKQKK